MGSVDLAVERALGAIADASAMSPRPSAERTPAANQGSEPSADGDPANRPAAAGDGAVAASNGQAAPPARVRALETRIGYRFRDPALLDRRSPTFPR